MRPTSQGKVDVMRPTSQGKWMLRWGRGEVLNSPICVPDRQICSKSCWRRVWSHLMGATLAHARLCLLHVMWMTQSMCWVCVMRLCLTLVSVACDANDSVDARGVCDALVTVACVLMTQLMCGWV